ncbi:MULTISPECIES: response regulator transcription factor [Delftia]|uniref:Helix-turn-helix transcriptional regulator n=1 Tax=Delftia lacustris TaxID=558537 RepID=A0A7T3DGP6_9BURK|nr:MULTISPECIES: LuxR C-terminal-related transcriptional regulator [Delftia]EPD38406.1 hypothetical protein HMPREF9702_04586 [Delftia acidovorans CCUG 15835]KAA9173617.1 helix-turn-helix transcriptional regulator [Delftia sp. BR1]QPS82988.1 helix-turn-helix transcriptional regulator [Delftia lacustris]
MDISEIALANSECHLDAEHPTADEVIASALTAREIDVLEAMAKGLGCKDIAHTLGISEHTVRKHRSNMCTRLGLRNAVELLTHARRQGWLRAARSPLPLSPREQEVLVHVLAGHTSKEIARSLYLSDLTVRKHRENILRKLGLTSTAQLQTFAPTATRNGGDT